MLTAFVDDALVLQGSTAVFAVHDQECGHDRADIVDPDGSAANSWSGSAMVGSIRVTLQAGVDRLRTERAGAAGLRAM